jgi:hypothetical protein
MDYNKANAPECATPMQPALTELGERLQECVNRFDGLTIELKNKLQTIKRFDEPCLKGDEKEKQPECIMDELNRMVFKIRDYNKRLEECLRHLNQIA